MSDTPRGRVAVVNAPALLIRVENAFATIVVIALLQVLLVLVVVIMSLQKDAVLEVMKTTTTIVKVKNMVNVEAEINYTMVNIVLAKPVKKFVKNEDGDMELVASKEMGLRMSQFQEMLITCDELTPFIPFDEKPTADKDMMAIYHDINSMIVGATLVVNKEEVTEPVLDDEGKETGETRLAKFGETTYQLTLNAIQQKRAMQMMEKLMQ